MKDCSEKFAIVGAGPVGLAVAKALKQNQIAYDQFEADDDVGGNWYHGVYRTAHIISSKLTTEYPDYKMPAHYPDFPSAQQMLDYLRDYARHFKLRGNIEFNTKLVMAHPLADERWEIELSNGEKRIYKGLITCNGHHWDKRFPNYEGTFTGEYIHSKDYKDPQQLTDKRVLVIGGGNSACDVAAEAARVGKSCDLSLRRGYWFLPKTLFGKPIADSPVTFIPVFIQRLFLRAMLRVVFGKYETYGLPKPDHKIFEHHPTLNNELIYYMKHGRIKPRKDVSRFEGNKVFFVDGSVSEYDIIVCGTGYHLSFPFLPKGIVPVDGGLAYLYAGCVLPDYKNLYIFGTSQPRYGFGPLVTPGAELLCQMIKMQDEMELPIGFVMKESGMKLPTTHLVNPIEALRKMRRAKWLLPLLLRKEKRLRNKLKEKPTTKKEWSAESNPDLQVY
jgi:cation diffusion facilitator CzcD-associated flavoprotein CzcO